ncbi:MAG: SGNH/GDSL hydrolase family protein [Polyangiaceae bacterium]|nr:SGNH/GDSL hydrolase family protein [Polyangiaceae bacterium]
MYNLITVCGVFLLCFGLGEVGARVLGKKPWSNSPRAGKLAVFEVEPGGTIYSPHPTLGFALLPGKFTVKQSKVTWHVTNLTSTHRVTRPEGSPSPEGKPGVWVFGDSYTYGWAVDDENTYSWKLQEQHPELHVTNFGVGGFSTLQSMIELEDALAEVDAGKLAAPRVVTLGYASFHDGRSAMLRQNRKSWIPYVSQYPKFPRAWLTDGKLNHALEPLEYDPWPFQQTSALVNVIEEGYNKFTVLSSGAKSIAMAILTRFFELCQKRNITFVLAGINMDGRTAATLQWAAEKGMVTIDMSLDHTKPENVVPGDGHPSPKVHAHYAETLGGVITKALTR